MFAKNIEKRKKLKYYILILFNIFIYHLLYVLYII